MADTNDLLAEPKLPHTHNASTGRHAGTAKDGQSARQHTHVTITAAHSRYFSHVDGVVAEEVKLDTADVLDLKSL